MFLGVEFGNWGASLLCRLRQLYLDGNYINSIPQLRLFIPQSVSPYAAAARKVLRPSDLEGLHVKSPPLFSTGQEVHSPGEPTSSDRTIVVSLPSACTSMDHVASNSKVDEAAVIVKDNVTNAPTHISAAASAGDVPNSSSTMDANNVHSVGGSQDEIHDGAMGCETDSNTPRLAAEGSNAPDRAKAEFFTQQVEGEEHVDGGAQSLTSHAEPLCQSCPSSTSPGNDLRDAATTVNIPGNPVDVDPKPGDNEVVEAETIASEVSGDKSDECEKENPHDVTAISGNEIKDNTVANDALEARMATSSSDDHLILAVNMEPVPGEVKSKTTADKPASCDLLSSEKSHPAPVSHLPLPGNEALACSQINSGEFSSTLPSSCAKFFLGDSDVVYVSQEGNNSLVPFPRLELIDLSCNKVRL